MPAPLPPTRAEFSLPLSCPMLSQLSKNTLNLIGWILFIISAIGFIISSIGSFWAIFGGVFFRSCLPCVPDPLLPQELRLRHFRPFSDTGG